MSYGGALSGEDILNHAVVRKYPVRLVDYSDLQGMNSIEDLFQDYTAVVLLYNVKALGNGHWVLLIKHKKDCDNCTKFGSNRGPNGKICSPGVIEFFDPYGKAIDYILGFQSPSKRRALQQTTSKLSHLLGSSPYCIVYNDQPLQKKGPRIETCGHHCLARLRLRHLDVDDYADLIRRAGPDPDLTVSQMYRLER